MYRHFSLLPIILLALGLSACITRPAEDCGERQMRVVVNGETGCYRTCREDAECPDGESCDSGVCVGGEPEMEARRREDTYSSTQETCEPPHRMCTAGCVDIRTNRFHCGHCDRRCAPTESCRNGSCVETHADCGAGEPVDLSSDPKNCGSCGYACEPEEVCENATCKRTEASCADDELLCNGICVDPSSHSEHCGRCGNACDTGVCTSGICQSLPQGDCPDGWIEFSNNGNCYKTSDQPVTASSELAAGLGANQRLVHIDSFDLVRFLAGKANFEGFIGAKYDGDWVYWKDPPEKIDNPPWCDDEAPVNPVGTPYVVMDGLCWEAVSPGYRALAIYELVKN